MLEILLYLLFFVVLIFWMWVTITTAVVAVAKGRNPVRWTFMGLLLGPIALYVLSHMSQGTGSWGDLTPSSEVAPGPDRPCPQCGVANPALEGACWSCGAPMPRERVEPPKLAGEADTEDSEQS